MTGVQTCALPILNTSTFWKVGMTIEEQTDTTNAEVNLNAPTLELNASSNISLNADSNIYLIADSNIYLIANTDISLNANTDISITGDSGVYIATPKLILNGALELWAIDSATLYATSEQISA